jgi:hypothetical protein
VERLATEVGVSLRRVGAAGGATLFGVEVSRLRDAWEGPELDPSGPAT